MADITRVITLGIGPASDIAGLVLVGLNPEYVIIYTFGPVIATGIGEIVRAYDYCDLSAIENTQHGLPVYATDAVTITLPTPGVEITICTPGVTLSVLTLSDDVLIPVAWTGAGVLEAAYEAATGKTAISSFGCYAMAAIGSKLYLGLGDFPGGTDGAAVISTTDGQVFVTEKVLDEQGIHDMSVHSGVLWVPGTDPTDDWTLGNVYDLTAGTWTKTRTLPNVIHALGLWHDGTHLHVGVGAHTGDNATWLGQTFRSADNGATWAAAVTVNNYRIYDVIGFGVRLYAIGYLANLTKVLYYSDDDGATWNVVAGITPATNPRMVLWGNYLIGVTSTGGLFSVNSSFVASLISPGFTADYTDWNVLTSDADHFFALSTGGMIYRTENLNIWNLYCSVANAIAIYLSGGYLWISASGQIFRMVAA